MGVGVRGWRKPVNQDRRHGPSVVIMDENIRVPDPRSVTVPAAWYEPQLLEPPAALHDPYMHDTPGLARQRENRQCANVFVAVRAPRLLYKAAQVSFPRGDPRCRFP